MATSSDCSEEEETSLESSCFSEYNSSHRGFMTHRGAPQKSGVHKKGGGNGCMEQDAKSSFAVLKGSLSPGITGTSWLLLLWSITDTSLTGKLYMDTDYEFCIAWPFSPQGRAGPSIKRTVPLHGCQEDGRLMPTASPPQFATNGAGPYLPLPWCRFLNPSRKWACGDHSQHIMHLKGLNRAGGSLPSDPWETTILLLVSFTRLGIEQCGKKAEGCAPKTGMQPLCPLNWHLPPQSLGSKQEMPGPEKFIHFFACPPCSASPALTTSLGEGVATWGSSSRAGAHPWRCVPGGNPTSRNIIEELSQSR